MFPEEGSFDLQRGAEVRILGALVGSLEEISVAEEGEMSGVIRIRGNFIRFVRTDSRAIAKKKFGLAGDAYLEITKGSGPPLPEDAVMKVEKDTEITEMIQEVIERVEEVALPAIKQVQKALEEYTNLAVDLRDKEGNLQQLLAHLSRLAEGLEKGEGTAGQLLRDPSLAEELRAIAAKVDESLAEVTKILEDVRASTGVVKDEMQDVPGLVLQTRETMRETEKLVEAVQRHWLLRKYVEGGTPSTLISPAAVGGGR
ncbi:MAG: hypothetical protein BWY59_01003 [Verrucomicrobia bacterium ADurb.Bin345]|nr:MAG: hypothetical protein BWY59_01003 [Verrucomicrobia bacterium ADurb.Bin345]